MTTAHKPLFRPEAVRPRSNAIVISLTAIAARPRLARWAELLASAHADSHKETELRDDFLFAVFRDILGYSMPVDSPAEYTLKKEAHIQADGTFADAAFGRFTPNESRFTTVLEGKGPGDPLDKPYKSRKRSAVEQALKYAVELRIDWYLVTNLRETRLYCKRDDTAHFERFAIDKLATDDAEFQSRFHQASAGNAKNSYPQNNGGRFRPTDFPNGLYLVNLRSSPEWVWIEPAWRRVAPKLLPRRVRGSPVPTGETNGGFVRRSSR